MWDLPRPGIEPVSLALAGGFSTTAPPGKPLPKLIYRFNTISTKLSARIFLWNVEKLILKFIRESKGAGIVKTILKKRMENL